MSYVADLVSDFTFAQITSPVTAGDTYASVDDISSFPSNTVLAKGSFWVCIESTLAHPNTFEVIQVTSTNSGSSTVNFATAAQYGHASGTYMKGTISAAMIRRLRAGVVGSGVPTPDSDVFTVGDRFFDETTELEWLYNGTSFALRGGARQSSSITTSSLAANASTTTTIPLALSFTLLSISTSVPARVELYTTSAAQTADASRAIGTDPDSAAGVILDYVTPSGSTVYSLSPQVAGSSLETSPTVNIPITVTNMNTSSSTVTVTVVWLGEE